MATIHITVGQDEKEGDVIALLAKWMTNAGRPIITRFIDKDKVKELQSKVDDVLQGKDANSQKLQEFIDRNLDGRFEIKLHRVPEKGLESIAEEQQRQSSLRKDDASKGAIGILNKIAEYPLLVLSALSAAVSFVLPKKEDGRSGIIKKGLQWLAGLAGATGVASMFIVRDRESITRPDPELEEQKNVSSENC